VTAAFPERTPACAVHHRNSVRWPVPARAEEGK